MTITDTAVNHVYAGVSVVLSGRRCDELESPLGYPLRTRYGQVGWRSQTEVMYNFYFSENARSHNPYIMCRIPFMCQAILIKVIL